MFGKFPRLIGCYCSYLLPKQDGGTSQNIIFKTLRQIDSPALYLSFKMQYRLHLRYPSGGYKVISQHYVYSFDDFIADFGGYLVSSSFLNRQWKTEQVWPCFGCCTSYSHTDAGSPQLYNNGSLILFSTACFLIILD